MMQKMTCGAIALLATACLPISASADVITLPFTLSIPANTHSNGAQLFTSAFNEFNPSFGNLTGVSVTLSGGLVWTVTSIDISDFLRLNLTKPG